MQKLTTFKGLKKGQKIKVLDNYSGCNWEIGKTYTLIKDVVASISTLPGSTYIGIPGLNSIYLQSVELVSENLIDLKRLLKELTEEKNKTIAELKRKIKFCEDNDLDEYDTDVERVYAVLGTLNTKNSQMEKAVAIAKLIKEA